MARLRLHNFERPDERTNMSRRNLALTVLFGGLAVFSLAQAQNEPAGDQKAPGAAAPEARGRGGREGRGEGRRFDPAEMRERMLSNIKERMDVSDDEWQKLQ